MATSRKKNGEGLVEKVGGDLGICCKNCRNSKRKRSGMPGYRLYIYQLIDSIKINHSWIGTYTIVPWVRHGDGIEEMFWFFLWGDFCVSFVAPDFQTSTPR